MRRFCLDDVIARSKASFFRLILRCPPKAGLEGEAAKRSWRARDRRAKIKTGKAAKMTTTRIIRASDLVPRPWKNGGGVTWEIAIDPPGAGLENFRWRVSRARIEADGPFSLFPNCERWITCVEGAGFALQFEDGTALQVPPGKPIRFSGDRPALCKLKDGACADINVIARRDLVAVEVAIVPAPAALPDGTGSALQEDRELLVRLNPSRALRASFQPI
jgi:environmental stress-induced protein Ves